MFYSFKVLGCKILVLLVLISCSKGTIDKPNILFISVDDLNDWTEVLDGNNQVYTPFLKEFSKESVNFSKNYCTSPGCNPSRATMMTGIHTYNSGMYSNYQDWRKVPKLSNAITIPEFSKNNGYLIKRDAQYTVIAMLPSERRVASNLPFSITDFILPVRLEKEN